MRKNKLKKGKIKILLTQPIKENSIRQLSIQNKNEEFFLKFWIPFTFSFKLWH